MHKSNLSREQKITLFREFIEKGKQDSFPVSIEKAWPVAFSSKSHAIRAVRKHDSSLFVEEKIKGNIVRCNFALSVFEQSFLKDRETFTLFYDVYYDRLNNNIIQDVVAENVEEELPDTLPIFDNEHISSVEMARLTGKSHSDLMKAIRKMEEAWTDLNQGKFSLVTYQDKKGETRPCYLLTKTECIYIATKFNDEARAKLILRWDLLEKQQQKPLTQSQLILQQAQFLVDMEQRTLALEQQQSELANKLDTIERNQKQAELELFSLETSDNPVPEVTLRTKTIELVAKYAETRFPTEPNKYQLAWRFFYDELLRRYHFRAYEDPSRGYKKLDDVEQRGAMQKLFDLVSFHIKKLQGDDK